MISPVLPTYARADLAFERGEGAYLTSTDGRTFLDFGAGVAVNAFGHANPRLIDALTTQAKKVWHTSNLYRVPGQEKLAARLVERTFADTVFFCNSGAEACELAIKMTRRYHFASGNPQRNRIITFEGAFHGRTLATIAAGGNAKYLEGFEPKMDGFDQVPLNDLAAVKAAITDGTAGVLIEPMQGEGGIRVADASFLRALRQLCDENGLLLVYDEVQCGFGRTGKLFAYEWSGAVPDIMAIAKALGGGFPVGACLATEKAGAPMTPGTHGSTYGGNPLAMAVANEAFSIVTEPDFLAHVQRIGLRLKQRLAELKDSYPSVIEEIRGQGLLLGLKLKVPNSDFVNAMYGEGVLTIVAGENVVRIMPPLIIGEAEIDEAMAALSKVAARFAAGRS
ncbi:MAG TPA: aspartate aminotransferase family protein [Alphaproteobacteria bacterium]|nr:aspartate aminotransferase family protein [Alphaproteobacteria bacterium]